MRVRNLFANRAAWPIFGVFFLEAFVLGNWIPRIPDVKVLFGLSASGLGFNLFMLSFGTLIAFGFVGQFLRKAGLRVGNMVALPLWALFICLIPWAGSPFALACVLILAGVSVGVQEVAMNTAADAFSKETGDEIMSRSHGCWSLGSLAGALVGAGVAALQIDVQTHFALLAVPAILLSVWVASKIDDGPHVATQALNESDTAATFQLPSRHILLLCALPIGVMLVEGAFIDWSAVFVKLELGGGPIAIGLIYAAFSTVMAVTRLAGDDLIAHYGAKRIATASCLSAIFGISLFALSPNTGVAFLGALFSGLGVAIVYPICVTAAARRPGKAEDNVAAISLCAFCAFMIAPPIIGFVADWVGLRIALLLIVPFAVTSYFLTPELEKKTP